MRERTEAQRRADKKYRDTKIKRVPFDIRREEYEDLQAAATEAGESVNGYIKEAIRQRMRGGIRSGGDEGPKPD